MVNYVLTTCKKGGFADMKKPGKSHGFTGLIEITGGAKGIRTPDPYVANVMLYQLSYSPLQKTKRKIV